MADVATAVPALMCPILTQVQVVPRGIRGTIKVQMVPVGTARVQTTQGILAGSKGGFDPGPQVMVYEASGTLDAAFGLKTPVGIKQNDPDPPLAADTLVVPCQGAACKFWGEDAGGKDAGGKDVGDCRLVAGGPTALAAARGLLNRSHENYDKNMAPSGPKEGDV